MKVERYLQRATRGLWGRKRQEVREELEGHISERVMAYRIAGLREEDAVEKALVEMGEPREVSAGMTRIYIVPWVAGSSMLVTAVCLIAVALFSSSKAQSLYVIDRWPTTDCLEDTENLSERCRAGDFWTSFANLREALEPQGVKFLRQGNSATLTFPGAQPVHLTATVSYVYNDSTLEYRTLPGYLTLWDTLDAVASQADIPVSLSGWENPTFHVGDASLRINLSGQIMGSSNFYSRYLEEKVIGTVSLPVPYSVVPLTPARVNEEVLRTRRFRVDAEKGDVFGVVVIVDQDNSIASCSCVSERSDLTFFTDVAPTKSEGVLQLSLPKDVVLGEELDASPEPGTAVLVRLSGDSFAKWPGYEIVPPEQISVLN